MRVAGPLDRGASLLVSGRLQVDWQRCQAHGLCHELLPEVVSLDDWGYPVIQGDVPNRLDGLAKRAVTACPTLALRLVEAPATERSGRSAPESHRR
jgi:ferredoxin